MPGSMAAMTGAVTSSRRPLATSVGWLSVIAAAGSALLAIGHLGVDVPVLSALGPRGNGVVPVAAAVFTVGALLYAAVAAGAFSGARWAWPLGLSVNALALLSGLREYRGTASAIGIVLALAGLALLLAPAGRRELRGR
jgi:hypothetical protein